VNLDGLIWGRPGERREMNWQDLRELIQVKPKFRIHFFRWIVRSQDAEIRFRPRGLKDSNGLPALIYEGCPQLWDKIPPIADPKGR